ncbi:MAG: prolyl oligopeptidase family serine peptidase [Saprospiraceae bacterium]|nr:prolyl oligopeptidase family serine peptidase [Saprospiraceae bacterium]MCF8252551.1 prolyl oligopeptidase family serine peptidase [Saprospiraceae bacterium]MCF8282592.1 prolyl oligopeptidase family serine peptidase [Bacteroidales bacterium]MCF8310798.1 prolyl oligopeptidase family serine peptidase [Saprospiraceae bacterium]MCF8439372.1 prolyl oligopeptidase family serine peptidase [Saprospiraceae bacterium]
MRFTTCIGILIFSFSLSPWGKIAAQTTPVNLSTLTIEQIMQGESFVGALPENISWSDDSKTVFFTWNPDMDTLRSSYKIGGANPTAKPEKLTNDELMAMPGRGSYSRDFSKKVFAKNGDLFLLEFVAEAPNRKSSVLNRKSETRQITNTLDYEGSPRFSGDEKQVLFEKEKNLYAWNIAEGTTTQLTDFKKGTEKKDKKKSAEAQWLEDDQLVLFDILAERKADQAAQKRQRDALQPKRPKPIFYGEKRFSNIAESPDLRFITFNVTAEVPGEQTEVPNYVTESGKVEQLKSRPKVGGAQDETSLGIWDRERDTVYYVETKNLEGIRQKALFLQDYHRDTTAWEPLHKNPKPVNVLEPVFSEDGKAVVVVLSHDNKDRWIAQIDLQTGSLKLLDHQHDEAWIGGPGIGGYNSSRGNIGWLDNSTIWLQSEETGYSHLYTLHVTTGEKRALTSGKFEILDAELSRDKRFFYINSNKETPFEQHFYRMPIAGGTMEKLTTMPGNNEVNLSPDERWLAIRYSYSNKPWELFIQENKAGAKPIQVTHSTTAEFEKYPWREPEMVWFKASDGVEVPARLYQANGSRRNGAAVVFVHGAGYLQNVHRWWSSYYREFMFHNFLADNGFTVLDVDYRGSQGYGRDWRTAVYRFMGGKDLSDQVDGAHYLAELQGIDPGRIGIYGGSYGGFITLMAMFTAPGTFRSGAALRSVTDWAHYNHGYTSNILNTPLEDSIAYRLSSPIYHAEGFTQGSLVMLHGMTDTNVQFQDVVRLSQRLIELKKENWDLAVFPMENHGFVEPSSWVDEYRRIWGLFWGTLR